MTLSDSDFFTILFMLNSVRVEQKYVLHEYFVTPKRETHVDQICLMLHRKGIPADKK